MIFLFSNFFPSFLELTTDDKIITLGYPSGDPSFGGSVGFSWNDIGDADPLQLLLHFKAMEVNFNKLIENKRLNIEEVRNILADIFTEFPFFLPPQNDGTYVFGDRSNIGESDKSILKVHLTEIAKRLNNLIMRGILDVYYVRRFIKGITADGTVNISMS